MTPEQRANLLDVRANADCLYSHKEIETALETLAQRLNHEFSQENPLVMGVMTGAMMTLGRLLTYLDFPLEIDYLHASRYKGNLSGEDKLEWIAKPTQPLVGRTVLLVDDILDEGITLSEIIEYCMAAGAKEVKSIVLVEKIRERGGLAHADFSALLVPDRYVFGFGMDYKNYWRNLDGIYAVAETL